MEREIKFRGISLKTGKFIEGFYFTHNNVEHAIIDSDFFQGSFQQINVRTLGQFTGLKDKNGTHIYEGDILADSERKDWDKINFVGYEVFYHDNDCCEYNVGFQMNRHHFYGSICGTSDFRKFIPKTVSKMEVIGNIHEHPELLKQLEK